MEIDKKELINLYEDNKECFIKYKKLIDLFNEKCGLTTVLNEDFLDKHFYDSLTLYPLLVKAYRAGYEIADVGTGAGFPGIPVAMIRPDFKIDLIESNHKKAEFLKTVKYELDLKNIEIICSNVREIKKKYDIIFFRAFSSLDHFFKVVKPIIKDNAIIFAMKGKLSEINKEISVVKNEKIWKYIVAFEIHKITGFDWERNILELIWEK